MWTPADIPGLTGRRALVTGVTSGLGRAVALELAKRGAEVVMAGRHPGRLAEVVEMVRREVLDAAVQPLLMDLADQASVRRAAAEASRLGPLHLLVNNAGVMATPYSRTVDGFELQTATNVLGPFALTGLLLPRLLESGDARVVAVSSVGHRLARSAPVTDPRLPDARYHRWQTYAGTKLANLMMTFELDRRAREADAPLRALAAHPGFASTGLMASGGRGRVAGSILDAAFRALGQDSELGAMPILMAATADLPGSTYTGPGGVGEVRGLPQIVGTSKLARDPDAAAQLWRVAQGATGVVYPWGPRPRTS